MTKPRKGLALLSRVYEELYASLGEDAEPLKILEAAQLLIDLSENPHKFSEIEDGFSSPTYYSGDTSRKIGEACWEILANERINANADDLDYERIWQNRLRSRYLRKGNVDDD